MVVPVGGAGTLKNGVKARFCFIRLSRVLLAARMVGRRSRPVARGPQDGPRLLVRRDRRLQ